MSLYDLLYTVFNVCIGVLWDIWWALACPVSAFLWLRLSHQVWSGEEESVYS